MARNRSANYTMVFNALDYTCCVFPVSKVDPAIDVRRPAHDFYNEFDKTNYEFCAYITAELFVLLSLTVAIQMIPKYSKGRRSLSNSLEVLMRRRP